MMERLMKQPSSREDPAYTQFTEQIAEIRRSLAAQLDQAGQKLLDQLADAYLAQCGILSESAFADGFCAAVGLAVDCIRHEEL